MYIYPDNLKSKAVLWLWQLRDIGVIGVGLLLSVFALAQLKLLPPIVITALYAFLTIRFEDTSPEMRSFLPEEKLEQFKEFYESRIDNSLLINAMFVSKDFRCNGISTCFISLVKVKAKSLGFDKLSLFVLKDNLNAQKVYYSNGFKIAKEIKLKDAIKINHKDGIYLMDCDI